MGKTEICWATDSWNVITGCTPVSEGCTNCYARRMAKRLAGRYGYPEAPHEFDVTFHPDRLDEPLHWKKPRVVFVCSMGDLFHEDVTDEQVAAIFNMMQTCNNHMFLLLTKRPKRLGAFWKLWFGAYAEFHLSAHVALPNVWPGVTVETQEQMWRIDELRKIPAAKHFVSFEPLLGPISEGFAVDGVITGGESGPGARPAHTDWVRAIRDRCIETGIPFTFKAWGEWIPDPENAKRNLPDFWEPMVKVGKKAAGRLLDGKLWDEFPWSLLSGWPWKPLEEAR